MKAITSFLKVTIVGGVMFLVPAALVLVLLRHAMQLAMKVATPIAAMLPNAHFRGVAPATLIAALILLLIAFGAGLLARTSVGRRVTEWFEESVLGGMPQYRMVKAMAEGLAQIETGDGMRPVLYRSDEGWLLGYHLEDLAGGWVAVFLPAAPTPMSGSVMYVPADRIKPLDIGMPAAIRIVKHIGMGSADAFGGVDLGK